jgi:hypothetical protein
MPSNTRGTIIRYLTLSAPILLAVTLGAWALFARSGAEGADIPTDSRGAPPTSGQVAIAPERKYEIGDVARFVVGGGAVHQGPIVAHRLTSDNQWVYDVAFPATDGDEGSVWNSLEEFRILLVTEDSQLYQPRVEGLPVKLIDLATGQKVDEGIVTGGEPLGSIWEYDILVSTCEIVRPPGGLMVVLVNNLVEPFECVEETKCPEKPPKDEPRSDPDPTPTPTPEPTPEPDGTDGVTGSDAVEP